MLTRVAAQASAAGARTTPATGGWDTRIYPGLRAQRVAADVRAGLGVALGQIGVEAEYLLLLVTSFPGVARPNRATGSAFLERLAASLERVVDASAALEAATQGFLATLNESYPGLDHARRRSGAWWPAFAGYVMPGAPLEMRLRRCGFGYKRVLDSHLPNHMEAILEQMALTLYALSVMPPAGVVPISSLAQGLDELSSALQGEITPRHITGYSGDDRYPGALAAIASLQRRGGEDDSLERDIAWARAQYVAARDEESRLAAQSGQNQMRVVAAHGAYSWAATVGQLEGLRRYESSRH